MSIIYKNQIQYIILQKLVVFEHQSLKNIVSEGIFPQGALVWFDLKVKYNPPSSWADSLLINLLT